MFISFLQYYATVDAGAIGSAQNIRWLTRENVKDWPTVEDGVSHSRNEGLVGLADMAGCGQSVGGVVSDTAGTITEVFRVQFFFWKQFIYAE